MKTFLGLLVFLFGLILIFQGSDLNPLLSIQAYAEWLNKTAQTGTTIIVWIMANFFIGIFLMCLGVNIMKKPVNN